MDIVAQILLGALTGGWLEKPLTENLSAKARSLEESSCSISFMGLSGDDRRPFIFLDRHRWSLIREYATAVLDAIALVGLARVASTSLAVPGLDGRNRAVEILRKGAEDHAIGQFDSRRCPRRCIVIGCANNLIIAAATLRRRKESHSFRESSDNRVDRRAAPARIQ